MNQANPQVCPVCGVKILKAIGGDKVMFSVGPLGTRAMLWARVCKYTQKPGCINQNREDIGGIKPSDYYQSEL